jgi:serine protease AprX
MKEQTSFNALSTENAVPLLKRHATNSQHNIAVLLNEEKKSDKADKIKQFWIVNAIALNATPELIEKLSARDDVESVELDSQVHMIEDYSIQVSQVQIDSATSEIKRINATKAWEIGLDGTGINVSVIDTGIYATHPDVSGRVIKWIDYVSSQSLPYDNNGHGTHVAGTVGGNGAGGMTTGVAPNVSLFGAKVLDINGNGYSSNVIYAIEWSVDNKADIVSLSMGGDRDISLKHAINNAISAGVTVIAAAGNSGGTGTIIYPAGEKNVIAVGAVDSSDNIAYFSSSGPITVDGEILTKPDVSAPGVCINSLSNSGGYEYCWSGTSMATPHVSGTAALLLQAARKNGILLSPAQVKGILENTSVDLGAAGKDNTYGAGRIDVFKAVREYAISTINGTVLDKTSRTGIADVIVRTNTSISTVTNASGFYSFTVFPGTYDLTARFDPAYNTNNTITTSTIGKAFVLQDIELVMKPTGNITGSVIK